MYRSESHRGQGPYAASTALTASAAAISGSLSDIRYVPRGMWLYAEIPGLRRAADLGTRHVYPQSSQVRSNSRARR